MKPKTGRAPSVEVIHFAGRAGDRNDRAMAASPRLAAAFADRFQATPTVIGSPRPPLAAGWEEELDAAWGELTQLREHYRDVFARGAAPVTALGRCAASLATVPVVAQHRPDAVVVWFDAHADSNTPQNTGTGFLGGLALAGPLGLWESGLGCGLAASNTVFAGVRDLDPAEAALIDRSDLTLVPPGPGFADRLGDAVAGRPVYVHIDCDVLDPGIVPTELHVPDGLSLADLRDASALLARGGIVGLEVAELETSAGDEDLGPFLGALAPLLGRLADAS